MTTTVSSPSADVTTPAGLSQRRTNILRIGYLVMGLGLAITRWPRLGDAGSWGLAEGTVECMLIAMSVLALLGLRYPVQMLPILLFEIGWKLLWLGVVALPLWLDGALDGETRAQAARILWVVIVIAVVPWGHAVRRVVLAPVHPRTGRRSRRPS